MPKKRPYDQYCPIAQALDLIGDRWSMLIVRELFLGPARYGELSEALTPISTDVLAKRLRELETTEIIARSDDGSYELAPEGRRLAPVLKALGTWGRPLLASLDKSQELSPGRALQMLVISTSEVDFGEDRTTAVRAGDSAWSFTAGPKGVSARRGMAPDCDAVITTDGPTLWAILLGDLPLATAIASGALEIEGHHDAAKQLLTAHASSSPVAGT